ncbi:MAG: hypothetical protein KH972_06440 [Peptostreptococcaceae bacterium]|nr:hypothetical protein [uncultured Criibacterium sp.]MBS6063489.1 hypothetical protein [Peptostreptococcaceae bacterium]
MTIDTQNKIEQSTNKKALRWVREVYPNRYIEFFKEDGMAKVKVYDKNNVVF